MRKALLFTTIIIFVFISSNAQITKGSILLGGGISLSNTDSENPSNLNGNSISLNFSPTFGLALKDNLVTGIRLTYSHYNTSSPSINAEQKQNIYGGGVFTRKYYPLGKGFYLFGEASIGYLLYKYEYSDVSKITTITTNNVSIYVYPGVTYAVSRHFHLEASLYNLVGLSYSHDEGKETNPNTQNNYKANSFSISTNAGSSSPLNVGFRFLIGK